MKIDLRKPDLRTVEVGTVVITTDGFEFELVSRVDKKESWKDLTSGITWHDKEDGSYTFDQALEKFGDRLPTKKEFETADKHGFRDVLPNMNHWFWSASVYAFNPGLAWAFNGALGTVNPSSRFSVRCALCRPLSV